MVLLVTYLPLGMLAGVLMSSHKEWPAVLGLIPYLPVVILGLLAILEIARASLGPDVPFVPEETPNELASDSRQNRGWVVSTIILACVAAVWVVRLFLWR